MGQGVALFIAIATVLALVLGLVFGTTYLCAFNWQKTDAVCAFVAIAARWQTLISGLFALSAAAATVVYMGRQIRQAERDRVQREKEREEDWRRERRTIANTLLGDLDDTYRRMLQVKSVIDLDPPMSELSRSLVRDAMEVHPALALALQRHCTEIGLFSSHLRAQPAQQTKTKLLTDQRPILAYRAHVLSRCFAGASTLIDTSGKAEGPFMGKEELDEYENELSNALGRPIGDKERIVLRSYLTTLFETTGGLS